MKKGQLSLVLILIIFVVMAAGSWLYVDTAASSRLIESATKKTILPTDADTVSKFAGQCLKSLSRQGLEMMGF